MSDRSKKAGNTPTTMSSEDNREPVDPYKLLTEARVKTVLKADKGDSAQLTSWTIEDFTQKGDNFVSVVTSINVQYTVEGKTETASYVVKLSPCRPYVQNYSELWDILFKKEVGFYGELKPKLASELTTAGVKGLAFAECFYSSSEKHQEILFLEDLRPKGFKMFDRRKGMDVAHTILVVKELARLHAASVLLQSNTKEDLAQKHEFLSLDYTNFVDDSEGFLNVLLSDKIGNAEELLDTVDGFEVAKQWLAKTKTNPFEVLKKVLVKRDPFKIVCHGDCWNNNTLFRYNDDGDPVEVMLVDLQLCRVASPATDLTYLLYTSLTGDVRKANLDHFLATYHSTFSDVLEAAGKDPPFTLEQLRQEFQDKVAFGIIFSIVIFSYILSEGNDIPSFDNMKEEDLPRLEQEWKERTIRMMENNPVFLSRFLDLFNDMSSVRSGISQNGHG